MKLSKKEQLRRVFNLLNCLLMEYDLDCPRGLKTRISGNDSSRVLDTFTKLLIREVPVRTNLK